MQTRPDGQAAKTTPSHGVNPGSIPGQVMMMRLLLMRQPCVILLDSESCSDATVAQLVAQRIRNAWVAGSSPASGLLKKYVFTRKIEHLSKRKTVRCGRFS